MPGWCSGGYRRLGRDGPRVGPAVGQERVDHGGARQGKQMSMARRGVRVSVCNTWRCLYPGYEWRCVDSTVLDYTAVYNSALPAWSVFSAVAGFIALLRFPALLRAVFVCTRTSVFALLSSALF